MPLALDTFRRVHVDLVRALEATRAPAAPLSASDR
jgi:hypothetical protein